MIERDVESYLFRRVKQMGGRAYKWVSPGNAGVPDRIVMLPGGRLAFVELKAPGKKSRPLQQKVQADLRKMGFEVCADIDSKERVDRLLSGLATQRGGDAK